MKPDKVERLIMDLRRLAPQTGIVPSVACLGCGYEHNCSVHGCALMKEGADMIERLNQFDKTQPYHLMDRLDQERMLLQASEVARAELGRRLAAAERELHDIKSEVHCKDCIYMHDRGKGAIVCDKMNYAAVTEDGSCCWGEGRQ